MEINLFKLLGFLTFVSFLMALYYVKILTVEPNENKKMKMLKRVFAFVVLFGFINIYNITEDQNIKAFWLVVMACILNIYTVIHSTSKCHSSDGSLFPQLYRFKLSMFTLFITILISAFLWYSTYNDIFGFLDDGGDNADEDEEEGGEVLNEFESIISDNNQTYKVSLDTNPEDLSYCPESGDGDYDTIMSNLSTAKRNNCLEQEIRSEF